MSTETPNLKNIDSCAGVAAYTLRALADALEACRDNGGEMSCCGPRAKTEASA